LVANISTSPLARFWLIVPFGRSLRLDREHVLFWSFSASASIGAVGSNTAYGNFRGREGR
jgi:hypothetical protein